MIYNWYNIYNLATFNDSGLTSKELRLILDGINGIQSITIFRGIGVSVLFDDVFLSIDLNGKNPFEFESRAVYVDSDDEIWVGVLVED